MKSNYIFKTTLAKTGAALLLFMVPCISVSAQDKMGCVNPIVSGTDGPGTICEGETATLTATHNGDDVRWFDAATGGNLVGTGSPLVTDPLATTTSFFAESFIGSAGTPQTGGARVAPTNTSSSSVVNVTSPWGLAFNADETFTINSVDVYLASATPGDLVIQLKDDGLNIIEEVTIAAPAGNATTPVVFTVNLDFVVPTGTDYNLVAASSPVMVREFSSGHPGFPYPIGTVGSVTNGTINDNDTNNTVYYFFYNWTVTPGIECLSNRVEEIVTVNPTPAAPTGDANQTFEAGETLADLDVTGANLTWYSDAGATMTIPDTTPLVDGTTYYVSQTTTNCEGDVLAITVEIVLSVEEFTKTIAIYPNPIINVVNINGIDTLMEVTIYSVSGKQIFTARPDSKKYSIDMSNFATGTYFIKIATDFGAKAFKVSKQ